MSSRTETSVAGETNERPTESDIVVSVVIPTFNRSRLLREAIEALWDQTLPAENFEIIVVDNCSTDDTPELIGELQRQSPCRLVYHRMPSNGGPTRSRNTGAGLAQAQILAFTDSDCWTRPDWLERGLAAFRDGVAFVTGPVLNKPGQPVQLFCRLNSSGFRENPTFPTCNAFYRRDVFQAMGGFDETLSFRDFLHHVNECSDSDLAWRIKERGDRNVFVPELVVYHEVEKMTPWNWMLDPLRLFVVPALVKKHPQLRAALLHGKLFFFQENVLFYLAVAGVLLGITSHWAFLGLAVPYPLWVLFVLRQNVSLRKLPKLVLQVLLLTIRQGVICTGLIYGSIRFRSLVL